MKKYNCCYLLFLITLIYSTSSGQQTFHTTSSSVIGYLEYLPENYNSNSDKYPVVIFLHGLGERGAASDDPKVLSSTISSVTRNGPPKHVEGGKQFPFILISPQLKLNYGDWPTWYVSEVIEYCKTYLRIDEQRIYLTGLSLGGGGTWTSSLEFSKNFAAVAPICGSRISTPRAANLANENMPVWAFHGDADTTVPSSRTIAMVNAINACTPAPTPLAKITIYPGVGHNSWDNAYKTDNSLHTPNLYEWLLSYTNTFNGGNQIPLANAGADITTSVSAGKISISGTGSDKDGNITNYSWSQLAGPSSIVITNSSAAIMSISAMIKGDYIFKLTVTDNEGDFSSDYIKVSVQTSNGNILPIADAGEDKTLTLPTNSITIAGEATDPDGKITSYEWTEVAGPAAVLNGVTTSTLEASSLVSGSYVFRLTAKDNLGASKSDDVTVNVTNGSIESPAIANAGPDRILTLPSDPATLFGTVSEHDGEIVSYNWIKISGGSCTFTSTSVLRPKISNLSSGTYVFRLTITDDTGATSSDEVTVVADIAPVVNAGPDVNLALLSNSVTLSGSATDADGTIASYAWSKFSGPGSATLLNKNTATLTASDLETGIYVFKLTVRDNIGVQSADYVTVVVASLNILARSASAEEDTTTGLAEDVIATSTSSEVVLSDKNNSTIENSIATIFDENGKMIFAGSWQADLFGEVFSQTGLYIYSLIKDGKRMTGKVFISKNY